MRSRLFFTGVVLSAAAFLGACGSTSPTAPRVVDVTGSAALNAGVPLTLAACAENASCLALGTSAAAPSSVYLQTGRLGHAWKTLGLETHSTRILSPNAISCGIDFCLIVGSQSTTVPAPLVWLVDPAKAQQVDESSQLPSTGISSVSCTGHASCVAVVTTALAGTAALFSTADRGVTWTPWGHVTPTAHSTIACASATTCVLVQSTTTALTTALLTSDGGQTWQSIAPTQGPLSSISCYLTACTALTPAPKGNTLVSLNLANGTLTTVGAAPSASISSVSCATALRCVAVGSSAAHGALLERRDRHGWHILTSQYLPAPMIAVNCSANACIAWSASSVALLRP
jgi:hypothetical protein